MVVLARQLRVKFCLGGCSRPCGLAPPPAIKEVIRPPIIRGMNIHKMIAVASCTHRARSFFKAEKIKLTGLLA